jgi:group II intron reverse transcriptase/maturase
MMKFLQVRIKDSSLLLLIRRFLKAGYVDADEFVLTTQGTAQGGNLSPVLSNIFLHYVLDLWFEKKIKPKVRGVCQLVRYADDFLCMTQYSADARHIEQAMRERFAKFGLELHPEKTRIIHLDREQRCRTNRKDHQSHTFDFLGFTHYWGKSRKGNPTLRRKTSAKKFRKACKGMNEWLRQVCGTAKLKEWWPTLRAKLRGHYQYYGISGNSRAIERYHYMTKRLVFKWVNRRSQKVSFTWEGFNAYLEHYPLPEPCIVHHLYTLSFVS